MKHIKINVLALVFAVSIASSLPAQDVPENITTPDVVSTQTLGELHFKDGYPSHSLSSLSINLVQLI